MIPSPRHPGRTAAFTLIELLVVIAIIAVLAGMLMPAVRMVSESAKQRSCAGRLRQLHAAVLVYAQDNEGLMPVGMNAGGVPFYFHTMPLATLLGLDDTPASAYYSSTSVMFCPLPTTWTASPPGMIPVRKFAPNYHLMPCEVVTTAGRSLASIANPSGIILMGEGSAGFVNPPSAFPSPYTTVLQNAHGTTFNALFMDGHLQALRTAEVTSAMVKSP